MATLQIRKLEDGLYRLLQQAARRERRSLAQQAAITLEKALRGSTSARERRVALLDEIARHKESAWPEGLSEPAELVRQDRER